ncbi:MAG: class I SAM-dependent methyltransferase [Planctomycetota bacterium]
MTLRDDPMESGDGVLDTLLYEPKRRRAAMATLSAMLVLAVGFAAAGLLFSAATLLTVFAAGFFAVSILAIGKLVVVSHVHLRGTSARLEALNDRYDDTARWLERFDADTRESLVVAKRLLADGRKAQEASDRALKELAAETPRLSHFEKLSADTPRLTALRDLEKELSDRQEELSSALAAAQDAQTELRNELEEIVGTSEARLNEAIGSLRHEIPDVSSMAQQLEVLERGMDSASTAIAAVETNAAGLIDAAKSASSVDLASAKDELGKEIKDVRGDLTKVSEEHERKRRVAVHTAKKEASESAAKLARRLDDSAQLTSRLRGEGYVRFSRVLSQEAIDASSAFRLKLTPAHLKYLERKLQVIEGLCEGRLAGSVDDAIGRVLAGHLVKTKELRILEIGVLFGVGAAYMHHALAPRHQTVSLTLLDPFEGYYGKDNLDPPTGLPVTRAAVERNLERCGIDAGSVTILEGFSSDETIREQAEAAGPYHLIVIDGDHSAEGVRDDFENYAGMLRSGGLLVIDDYGSDDWPDVTAFVESTVRNDARFKPVAVIGKTAVFKRGRTPAKKSGPSRAARKPTEAVQSGNESQGENAGGAPASAATAKERSAGPDDSKVKPRAASRRQANDRGESKPAVDEAPVVETKRRAKRSARKSSSASSAVASAASSADDAAS